MLLYHKCLWGISSMSFDDINTILTNNWVFQVTDLWHIWHIYNKYGFNIFKYSLSNIVLSPSSLRSWQLNFFVAHESFSDSNKWSSSCRSFYLFIYLFICLFVCLFIYLFIHSFIHSFIYLFIYLLIYLFIYFFIYSSAFIIWLCPLFLNLFMPHASIISRFIFFQVFSYVSPVLPFFQSLLQYFLVHLCNVQSLSKYYIFFLNV